jgi:3',5'-cyclic AMP phosphodiesterase CpdA
VTWRTDTTAAVGAVQYAIASPGPGFGVLAVTDTAKTERIDARAIEDAGVVVNFHSVELTGLLPDTLYAYRVGDGTEWTEWFHFRTASREPKPFSFIYFGDAQNDILSLWSRTIRSSFAEAPDARFMIHAGDLINNGHNDLQWGEWFRAGGWIHAMMPSVPAAGNHEYDPFTPEEEEKDIQHLSVFWRPQFALPLNGVTGQEESNYYIDYQGTRILVLNSNEQREDQAAWLEKVLADNPHPWTIATFHHPLFSAGQERDNPVLRALWKPLFDKYGVDLVLQGHDHTYARGRTFATLENVGTGVNARDDATGTVYVVSVSGRKMYNFKKGEWSTYAAPSCVTPTPAATSQQQGTTGPCVVIPGATLERKAENTQLFQVIRIAGDTLRYTAYTAVGGVYDAFDLIRRKDAPNRFVERMKASTPTRTFADPPPYPW